MKDDDIVGVPYYGEGQRLDQLSPDELEALAESLNVTGLPPRPWTPRERHRIETAVSEIQRRDYIYGGAPARRQPTALPPDMPGRFIVQWNIDGPWQNLRSFDRYPDAESYRDQVLRQYGADGVTFEDLRIEDTERRIMGHG